MPNINKNIIKQAGAAVANATNKAAGLPASTPEPGSIISAIQLVNGGRTIGPDALAHFTESVRNKLLSLLVTMEPIQDFNGYTHPWPGGGGKNKLENTAITNTVQGVTYTVNSDGTIGVSGKSTGWTGLTVGTVTLPAGDYILSAGVPNTNWYNLYLSMSGDTTGETNGGDYSFTLTGESTITVKLFARPGMQQPSGSIVYPMIRLATVTDGAYAPFSNICPISGRTGANAYVSPTPNVADATTYTADWTTPAGTVYAGSADVVSGDIKAAPYYASYNGETLVGPWVSSMDVYDPEETPTTGAQVVDLGGAMTEYHITGQDIVTLVGDNYIWSDSGDVTITE